MEKTRNKYEKEKTMTLFKQMALAISLIIIFILASVLVINYQSAKSDMIEALYENSVNNISSLQNKLSLTQGEQADIISTIDSEFDSGYYRLIEYRTADNSFSYKQEDKDPIEGVPQWFVKFTDIHIDPITADVNDGWTLLGKVTIIADPSSIYKGLYKNFIKLLYLFLLTVTIALVVVAIMLHFILKPLKRIQHQAEAILRNEFVIDNEEPYTTEFKEVSHAMNAMVKKVEEIFNKANEAARRNNELLYNDPVTKLFNRRYLILKLPELLELETKIEGGSILLIALNGAEHINEKLGRKDGDIFFFEFANILREFTQNIEDRLLARVNGTEFTLVLPDCESFMAQHLARKLFEGFEELLEQKELDPELITLNIGIFRYRPQSSVSEALTKADDALTKAKADTQQHIYIYEQKSNTPALPKEKWRDILVESIEKEYFELRFWPILDMTTKEIKHKAMTFIINDNKGQNIPYGDFIGPAITLGLVSKIYLVALKKLLRKQHKEIASSIISIRLSNEFLKDAHAFEALNRLLKEHAKKLSCRLSFEVADNFAISNTPTVKGYVDLFRKFGFGFGINNFSGACGDYSYLKELNPDFIKADVSFLLDQTAESMHTLELVIKSLGIEIIASFVKTEEELQKLQKLKIDKIQGPITEKLL